MPRTVLFLCTGNYYRSRFAEEIFNHLAERRGLDWRADSSALAVELGVFNFGPISKHTLEALRTRGCAPAEECRGPKQVCHEELSRADLVVALKEAEHRPLLAARYPGWEEKVEYWHIHDLDQAGPEVALAEIEQALEALIQRLGAEH